MRDTQGLFGRLRNAVRQLLSRRTAPPITDVAALGEFLSSRASFVTQASLYGYLRTRAGTRYPELMSNDAFVREINRAKWNIWVACLSDLSMFAGHLLVGAVRMDNVPLSELVESALRHGMAEAPVTDQADREFPELVDAMYRRVRLADWTTEPSTESMFCESPRALVRWAPIVDQLKQLDEEIVSNSVRFRWQEVRRELRRRLVAADVVASRAPITATPVVANPSGE